MIAKAHEPGEGTVARLGMQNQGEYFKDDFPVEVETPWPGS
jgi:hypothetical protein